MDGWGDMKIFDEAKRTIRIQLDYHEINKLVYDLLIKEGYNFEKSEIDLKWEFVKEGSPEYTTGKIKCSATIVKDLM